MENTNTNPVAALVASTASGPLNQDQALSILNGLIGRSDIPADSLAQTFQNIIGVFTAAFTPVVAAPEKKRRKRRTGALSPNLGWPKGVSREDYATFKAAPPADFTEGMNPQAYKRYIDAKNGVTPAPTTQEPVKQEQEPTPAPAPTVEVKVSKAAPVAKPAGKSPAALAVDTTNQATAASGRKPAKSSK